MPTSTLKRLGKALKATLLLLTIFIVLFFIAIPFLLSLLGFYPNGIGWKVAKEIVARQGRASDCNKIVHLIAQPLSPSEGEQRSNCIYEYAKLSKDPSACELLMPSEYGLACISNLWLQAMPGNGCGWNYVNTEIYECREGYGPLRQSKNCTDFSDNPLYFSACIEARAHRKKDLTLCKEIPDAFIRSFCEVKIGAWIKYPELRNSFYFGQDIKN